MTQSTFVTALAAAGILAVGVAAGGVFIGKGVENARVGDRSVTVRGVSERQVKADLAVLPLKFAAAGDDLAAVQAEVGASLGVVGRYLAQQGYAKSEIDLGRFEVTDQYAREYQASEIRARYRVAQTVIVRTTNVDRVQATTRSLDALVRQGVVLQDYNGPSYIFTKLNDVRPKMIAEATASARTGAQQFAKDSGTPLGGIASATQGSFEILGRDDVGEESSQVFKRVRVVTTITYRLR
ncbi:MAG: SIMPL domain-containing protein [Alphaproteobacteria bacterium]|nr:SIMPL domain-containing protein [Alphaproteobacteria bacterium]MBU1513723.1 SIMPL domain-containing protein [Alphaproteobacteria bacterium]MBU2094632.1 SIMPL domain-containing protein [Alphaproteobacteria bacterium]MBU2150299.1 SIMPL domain-containing protein [Alphaproteobacteria bacterium]MBU2309172.1 SIMPL domain-containing protein [Alphaproteobacteria bacterium]